MITGFFLLDTSFGDIESYYFSVDQSYDGIKRVRVT